MNKDLRTLTILFSSALVLYSCRHSRREMALREFGMEDLYNRGGVPYDQAEVKTDVTDTEIARYATALNCASKPEIPEMCDTIQQFLNGTAFQFSTVKAQDFLIGKYWEIDQANTLGNSGYETLSLTEEYGVKLAKNFPVIAHKSDEQVSLDALLSSQVADRDLPKNAAFDFIKAAKQHRSMAKFSGKSLTYFNKGKVFIRANGLNLVMMCQLQGAFFAIFPKALTPKAR